MLGGAATNETSRIVLNTVGRAFILRLKERLHAVGGTATQMIHTE